jgi:hypothetical protein
VNPEEFDTFAYVSYGVRKEKRRPGETATLPGILSVASDLKDDTQ